MVNFKGGSETDSCLVQILLFARNQRKLLVALVGKKKGKGFCLQVSAYVQYQLRQIEHDSHEVSG